MYISGNLRIAHGMYLIVVVVEHRANTVPHHEQHIACTEWNCEWKDMQRRAYTRSRLLLNQLKTRILVLPYIFSMMYLISLDSL